MRHILRVPDKTTNAAAKTTPPLYLVMSIFCVYSAVVSFFCHLLCVLANTIDTTGYQKYASDNVGFLSKKKRKCIRLDVKVQDLL